jgi:hypothetical protein
MTNAKPLIALMLLCAARVAAADEATCQDLAERGYDACYRQNDAQRAECAGHCAHCTEQWIGCLTYCDHFCEAPYSEGCGFDLSACISRCGHRCHEPMCDENAACRSVWCSKEAVKSCSDTCQANYASLASCRAAWCGDGKSRTSCLSGCNVGRASTDACRKNWCGDGKAAQQCHRDADAAEQQCRKQVEASVKACLEPAKK